MSCCLGPEPWPSQSSSRSSLGSSSATCQRAVLPGSTRSRPSATRDQGLGFRVLGLVEVAAPTKPRTQDPKPALLEPLPPIGGSAWRLQLVRALHSSLAALVAHR